MSKLRTFQNHRSNITVIQSYWIFSEGKIHHIHLQNYNLWSKDIFMFIMMHAFMFMMMLAFADLVYF